jgi:hypothetical protein
MLLAAVDFRADHLKRIDKRLDGVGAASRICALPIGPDDFPTAIPSAFILDRPENTDRKSSAAPRTFIFKLRVIAFIFKTSAEGFGGCSRKALILLRIEQYRTNGKRAPFGIY